ncbi:amino acid ABC transporter permease [Pseudosulfitobacter pseudonitzschiae]|uniref:Glutamate/aspartate import permease protein GltK n=1 Tax=Pseudosulfitobacter pseudonitzschiae TaxID=1402135 RepID=A0A073J2F3_9RHOB|nr:amino acid ABC transporter permease [Pseudosulfitobacter pseudonitzschiae]KEJ96788.1 amino acid ABC transporter [Pseudosulfitobacter pseudonitzschiae]MBM1814279.1 amino acid ABC transporter permease [Pseudosulfitobacter pseudonitzschiae]MBM1831272.1 amino acid ABC transporter permease [Pseudosulfitobacter pseudonitzschiae]MBM1836139.1 amino acid ABC transporter permease [Pseudosulfitobacter pseudonitzschiae]MBM1840985.1 amino acid ABC transporter permease [Pseudosulfitobacter pseudonitzschi
MFSWSTIVENLPYLLQATRFTLLVSGLGMGLGLVMGIVLCVARLSPIRWISRIAALYVSFFRGVPLLVQLLLAYYFLPSVGIDIPPLWAAVCSIGLCAAAYIAEILRGALIAVPHGQAEAAAALGMHPFTIWKRILIPQALKISMPSLVNELIMLVKVSSLVSAVGIVELTRMSQSISAATFRPLEIYIAAAAIYLVINLALAGLGQALEKRLDY